MNPKSLPKTVTGKVWIAANNDFDDTYRLHLFTSNMSEYGYIMLDRQEITLELPTGIDLRAKAVESLEVVLQSRKEKVEEAKLEVFQIQEQIKSLQAIEYMPGEP